MILVLPTRGSDNGAVQMLGGHGPVVGGIAICVDSPIGRSDPVAAAGRRREDGGRRVQTPDGAERITEIRRIAGQAKVNLALSRLRSQLPL